MALAPLKQKTSVAMKENRRREKSNHSQSKTVQSPRILNRISHMPNKTNIDLQLSDQFVEY